MTHRCNTLPSRTSASRLTAPKPRALYTSAVSHATYTLPSPHLRLTLAAAGPHVALGRLRLQPRRAHAAAGTCRATGVRPMPTVHARIAAQGRQGWWWRSVGGMARGACFDADSARPYCCAGAAEGGGVECGRHGTRHPSWCLWWCAHVECEQREPCKRRRACVLNRTPLIIQNAARVIAIEAGTINLKWEERMPRMYNACHARGMQP